MTKKHLLALGAIACSIFSLASCDKIEASLTPAEANGKVLNIDQTNANTLQDIYDALITSGNSNSEKVLNNILYIYAESMFGSFISKNDTKGVKDVVATYLTDTSNTTEIDNFINSHVAYKVTKDGQVDMAASRIRVVNFYNDILYRVYTTFLGYVTNTSYQERNLFNEDKFYDAQIKAYYTLGEEHYEDYKQVEGDMVINEDNPGDKDGLSNTYIDKYFKNIWVTYSEYIELNILPDLYRNELTTEYMYTQNDAQINLTAARNVEYISLSSNAEYTDAVKDLMNQYCAKVIEAKKMDEYGFSFLSSLYKGTDQELVTDTPTTEAGKLAKEIYEAAHWTHRTITVGSKTIHYYLQSSLGTICAKYQTLLNQTTRDDSDANSVYSDFTNSGSYSKETGFNIKMQALIAEGHTTQGWYTSGGLSALPSSLSTRVFKTAVANEVDAHTDDYAGNYGRYIGGKYFLTPATYAESEKYPYLVQDGSNYVIVWVKEATKASKFVTSTNENDFYYDKRGTLVAEKIARKVAYSLSSIDTWKSDAKQYYVQQMAVMYHDDYVYAYFKSQFPDLFD